MPKRPPESGEGYKASCTTEQRPVDPPFSVSGPSPYPPTSPSVCVPRLSECRSLLASFSCFWSSNWLSHIPVDRMNSCAFSAMTWRGDVLIDVLGGPTRTSVFLMEDQTVRPPHPPTSPAPTTGGGILDWAAVSLPKPIPLLPSALLIGIGIVASFVVPILPLPPNILLHLRPPQGKAVVTAITRNATTVPAASPSVQRVSFHVPSPVWSAVSTSASTPSSTCPTVVVALLLAEGRTVTSFPVFGTLDASKALAKVSHFGVFLWEGTSDDLRNQSTRVWKVTSFPRMESLATRSKPLSSISSRMAWTSVGWPLFISPH